MEISDIKIRLWIGDDDFSISESLKIEKDKIFKKNRNIETESFDFYSGEDRSSLEKGIINSIRGASLFSPEKIIIIKNIFSSRKKKNDDELEDNKNKNNDFEDTFLEIVFKNSSDYIFFIEEKALDRRGKAFKFFEKMFKEGKLQKKEFSTPLNFEFNSWLEKEIKSKGGKISKENVNFLSLVLGRGMEQKDKGKIITAYNLFQSSKEIEKLIAYADGEEISKNDISLLVSSNSDMNIFSLIESIGSKDKKKALRIMSEQIEKGYNENYILTMLVHHFRNLIAVKSLFEKGLSPEEIAKISGMHPYVVKKNLEYCRNLNNNYLVIIYKKLYDADLNIKNGITDPSLALSLLVSVI